MHFPGPYFSNSKFELFINLLCFVCAHLCTYVHSVSSFVFNYLTHNGRITLWGLWKRWLSIPQSFVRVCAFFPVVLFMGDWGQGSLFLPLPHRSYFNFASDGLQAPGSWPWDLTMFETRTDMNLLLFGFRIPMERRDTFLDHINSQYPSV